MRVVVFGLGCPRQPAAPAPAPAAPTRGEIAGVPYLELMTGGAGAEERVPMIIALHPMGGDPAALVPLLAGYPGRARLIFPYGHPRGGAWFWLDSPREDVAAAVVKQETDRLVAAVTALAAARPTVGKPLVAGFSQGGVMAFSLAVTHPQAIAGAFPLSGLLPRTLYPAALTSASLPPVIAFHGADDLAVPVTSARDSVAELRRAGYATELHEYAGLAHDTSPEELRDFLERLKRAADAL